MVRDMKCTNDLCQKLGIFMNGCGMNKYSFAITLHMLDWTLESFGRSTGWCICKEGFNCLVLLFILGNVIGFNDMFASCKGECPL